MAIGNLQPGTIVAFWGTTPLCRLISWSTWGPSHVGIIARPFVTKFSEPIIFESTTLAPRPCCLKDEFVDGVQAHPLRERVEAYPGSVTAYHFHESLPPLTAIQDHNLTSHLTSQLGKDYDKLAAVLSVTHLLKSFGSPDLDTIFCSALVARALMVIGRMNFANPETYSPASLMRQLRREAIYRRAERLK